METIITTIVTAFKSTITGLGGGLVAGADALVWNAVSGSETKTLTTLFTVILTFTGFSIGFAIIKWLLGLLKFD